jgi:hypothetical protein
MPERKPAHDALVNPDLIYFVGRLEPHQQTAFSMLLSYAEFAKERPAGKRLLRHLQNFILTTPAVNAAQADRLVEVLKQHLVGPAPLDTGPRVNSAEPPAAPQPRGLFARKV